ncbi:MAG TPA: FHIPEP family type III secretion protein [Falsiroseomonas sp.]|jgi:hypothetical protein|nr:FHIPEP family type III secretion protein [Falsiroseomonas sp.]
MNDALRFIAARCGPHVACVPASATDAEGTGPPVLSLYEIHTGKDADAAAGHDLLVLLALQLEGDGAAPEGRVLLRLVTRSAMRSAGRVAATDWVATDLRVPAPPGLRAVSLLLLRVRRLPHLERALAAIEDLFETLEAAGNDASPALQRAALDWLDVLDGDACAQVLLGGHALPLAADPAAPGARYLALLAAEPPGPLWLREGRLHVGGARESAPPLAGPAYVLLRHGPQPTRQSVRDFIEEIRRRHPRGAAEPAAQAAGESFAELVDRQLSRQRRQRAEAMFGHHDMLPVVTPIALEVAQDLVSTVEWTEGQPSRFKDLLDEMRAAIEREYGVRVPGLRVRGNEGDLPAGAYIIMIDEVPLVMGTAHADRLLCAAAPNELPASLNAAEAETAQWPDGRGEPACWVPRDWTDDLHKAGFVTRGPDEYVLAHLRAVLMQFLARFATLDEVERAVAIPPGGPDLLRSLQEASGGVVKLAMLLRALLQEGLPVTAITALTEGCLESGTCPAHELAEELRLLPALRQALVKDRATWRRFDLDEAFEAALRGGLRRGREGVVLALAPEPTQDMLTAIRQAIDLAPAGHTLDVIVVRDPQVRPLLRSLLKLEFPAVRVVAARELDGLSDLPPLAATIGFA